MDSERKVMIVTGGGCGIGAAIVRQAAQQGYAVCFCYAQNNVAARQLVNDLKSEGHQVIAVRADVADTGAVCALFDQAERSLDTVTALVNNEGITAHIGRFQNADHATLRRIADVNFLSTMYCA